MFKHPLVELSRFRSFLSHTSSRTGLLNALLSAVLLAALLAVIGQPSIIGAPPTARSPEVGYAGGFCPPSPPVCSPSVCGLECFSCDAIVMAAERCAPPVSFGSWVATVGDCNAACGASGSKPISYHCEVNGTKVDDSKCLASEKPTATEESCVGAPCECVKVTEAGHVDAEKATWSNEYITKSKDLSTSEAIARCGVGFPSNWCDNWGVPRCCGAGAVLSHFTLANITKNNKPTWDCEPWCKCN